MHTQVFDRPFIPHQMSLHKRLWLLVMALCVLLGVSNEVTAQETSVLTEYPSSLSPTAQISFLAAAPSNDEVYTVYGHAGLRVWDAEQGMDVVFNYGIFDFSEDFLIRYLQGKTDYIVLPMPTEVYRSSYAGRKVREIVLETDSTQRSKMWSLLLENIKPENRVYRYNAFRNNCSTRPLDLYFETLSMPPGIEAKLDSARLVFPSPDIPMERRPEVWHPTTWRKVINRLESAQPWLVLGTDLAMGPELDKEMSIEERLFIPMDAAEILSVASYERFNEITSVYYTPCKEDLTEGEDPQQPEERGGISLTHPLVVFSFLLTLTLSIYVARARGKRVPGILEFMLYLIAGLGGSLLFFLTFFSEHPMVNPNWNLLVLHPTYLIIALLMPFGERTLRVRRVLHLILLLPLIAFPFVAHIAGQTINTSVYLIALSLVILSVGRIGWFPPFIKSTERHASH